MDGNPPSAPALPPLAQPANPVFRPSSPASVNPVGRPSNDPERQVERAERTAAQKRIEGLLPKSIDDKVLVYRSRDGKIPPMAKPIISVLASELEQAKQDDPTMETGAYVTEKLAEKGFTEGKFIARFVNRAGRPVPETQFDIILSEGEDGVPTFDPNANDDEGDDDVRGGFAPPPMQYPQQQPPPPPSLDPASFIAHGERVREDEAKRGSDIAQLISGQQAATTQMMMQLAQQQRESAELARRDAADREERERVRRADSRATLIGLVTAAAPTLTAIIAHFLKPKETAPDATTQMMMELFKAKISEKPEKGLEATMLETVMKTMSQMTTQQMAAMQQGTVLTAQMQGEATGLIFKNLMGTMKDLMDQKKEAPDKEKSTFQQVLEVAGPLLQGLAQQQQQASVAPPTNEQLAPPQAQPIEEAPQRRRRTEKVPPPAATAPAPTGEAPKRQFTDTERIGGCLKTIADLSTGKILPNARFPAIAWIKKQAPASLLDAVKAGDRDKVLQLGIPVVMGSPGLSRWFNDADNVAFLEAALDDLRHDINGTLTKEIVENSIINQAAFNTKKRQAAQATAGVNQGPPMAEVVSDAVMTAHPAATEAPTAEAATPTQDEAAKAETAAAETNGTPLADTAGRRRGRQKKQPPPTPPAAAQPGA